MITTLLLSAAAFAAEPLFQATFTHIDGRVIEGKVVKVERGLDWYAEKGWSEKPLHLTVTLEGNGTEVEKLWSDIAQVDVTYGGKTDFDCMYESEYSPWMYTCLLKTTPTVKTADGKTWKAISRYKWKFTLEDGSVEELWLSKLPARKQDTQEVTLETVSPENVQLYAELQAEALRSAKHGISRIVITR
jgi:hypothetical protein